MNLVTEAREFLDRAKDLKFGDFFKAFNELSDDLKEAVTAEKASRKRASVRKLFEEEGKPGKIQERLSPSEQYKLVVQVFSFEKGWNYSKGSVFRKGSDEPLFEVFRNYGHFPFLFIEGHPNGHAYLVCGEDYQGQTILELDTGQRRDFLPVAGAVGHGFCWTDMQFNAATQMLVVDGCIWACPYEYRFYDFSDPMSGWPEVEPEVGIYADDKWPEVDADGTIRCFQTEEAYDEDDDDDEPADEKRPIAAIKTFQRDGLKLKLVEEWLSETEKKRRADNEEARQKYEQWLKDFKAGDPLYLTMLERLKDPAFKPEDYISIGVTHDRWCPDFDKQERRVCRRIVKREDYDQPGFTVDLEWGADTGPIKLVIFKDGKHIEDKFFEHSVEGMNQAFSYAKETIHG